MVMRGACFEPACLISMQVNCTWIKGENTSRRDRKKNKRQVRLIFPRTHVHTHAPGFFPEFKRKAFYYSQQRLDLLENACVCIITFLRHKYARGLNWNHFYVFQAMFLNKSYAKTGIFERIGTFSSFARDFRWSVAILQLYTAFIRKII